MAIPGSTEKVFDPYPSRDTELGGLQIMRALPVRDKRMVGPWCFLDRYGPLRFERTRPMDVAPHPHIGLQTVSWLMEGEILHDDSLGCEALLRAGGVNVMTSGAGIAHSEQTPGDNTGRLDGVQLWIALREEHRHGKASLQHVERVPAVETSGGATVQVFAGSFAGAVSPARHYSEIVGADAEIPGGARIESGLNAAYEHAVFLLGGDCALDGHPLEERVLYYLGSNRGGLELKSRGGGRLLILGGVPFPEKILMWWNFVARSPEEIAEARTEWEEHSARFGEVKAYNGPRLNAPPLGGIRRT